MSTLAQVFEDAVGHLSCPWGFNAYSCNAVWTATNSTLWWDACTMMRECGVNTSGISEFAEFESGHERQMARAIWLTMLATIAEDEGL